MKRCSPTFFLVLSWAIAATSVFLCAQQQDEPESTRKVVSRVVPDYPYLARAMDLKGIVKVNVVVAPNGKAKAVEVRGGHPVLAQAAEDAIKKWKWETATHDTQELVEVNFNLHH